VPIVVDDAFGKVHASSHWVVTPEEWSSVQWFQGVGFDDEGNRYCLHGPGRRRLIDVEDETERVLRALSGAQDPRCADCIHHRDVLTWRSVTQHKCALTDDGTKATDIYGDWPACDRYEGDRS
jgi:hypothetical protein